MREISKIQKDGSLDKVAYFFRNHMDVWVRRSSGQWQLGSITDIADGGLTIGVAWHHPEKPDKKQGKYIPIRELLKWQDQTHSARA